MPDTIPTDAVVDGSSGHEQDHDNISDMLGLLTQAVAQKFGGARNTPPSGNSANVTAVQKFVTAAGTGHNSPIEIYPSGDTTGATDQATINNALANAGTNPVIMGAGAWYINRPIVMQTSGQTLAGVHGATASGDDAGAFLGTVIHITSTYTNPTWTGLATAAILVLSQNPGVNGASPTSGIRLRDFWIDGTNSPANVSGIVAYGTIKAIQYERIGVYKTTNHGFNFPTGEGTNPNGIHMYSCLAQSCGGTGFLGTFTDGTLVDCHAQNCNIGISSQGGDMRFIGCRADLSTLDGWVLDHRGAGDGYNDAVTLSNCGTQRNGNNGIRITNSSGTGATWSDPVHIVGGSFAEDGTAAGSWAGIHVEGQNIVRITGIHQAIGTVDTGNPGVPAYGLRTATIGSGNTAPQRITITGSSHIEGITNLVQDNANMGNAIIIDPSVTGNQAYQSASGEQARQGSATLPGTSAGVVVNSAWVTNQTRIILSPLYTAGVPGGFPYVSSRGTGTFTIKSTSNADTYTVQWFLLTN